MTDKNQDIQVNADELRRLVANKLEGAELIRKHALMIAIDPSTFISTEAFMRQRDAMVDQLHAVPAGPGCDQVLVPGDPELIIESAARKNGVTVIASTYEYLMGSA